MEKIKTLDELKMKGVDEKEFEKVIDFVKHADQGN